VIPDIKITVCKELPEGTVVLCVPSETFQIEDLHFDPDGSATIRIGWNPKKVTVLKGVDVKTA
jgi:hypothetical protein